ncbi:MAG: hypothetical protein QNJ31_05055 [Candidatus Caenarcaniphilales bacterium]|nr:hypothetical protein [Candidatus Caenarcaniphilales bacterium]
MDNFASSFALFKLTERQRDLAAEHLVKSNAPNAEELCTGRVHFDSVIGELEDKYKNKENPSNDQIRSIIRNNTETIPVRKSTRELAVELSQAYLMNLSAVRLMNHSYKQKRAILDFRAQ